jgi:2-keto-4-pentenoate hydratase/2-oxohepta-3-ene-1,7-dioic acid hydratase in catechol pathway
MRVANLNDRVTLIAGDAALDVERASGGRFGPDPQAIYARWEEFRAWAAGAEPQEPYERSALGPPVPRPRQVFALGLNYALHAREAGLDLPPTPLTFTKFPSCLTGPEATVRVPSPQLDWEVELVVVIGEAGRVAGFTVGQDLSARDVQMQGSPPQFSLGKSFPGFGPTGPWVVTPDELADPDDLAIACWVNGEQMQSDRTSSMLFGVAETIAALSAVCPLLPGDLIFTGTPAGVGNRRDPPRYLQPGDELVSTIEGIGTITTRFAE